MSTIRNPIFCALDTHSVPKAKKLVESLRGFVRGFKLGMEFFYNNGPAGYAKIAELGVPIFLDLKLHDIPNTVSAAMETILPLRPYFVTLHASGGSEMMKAAVATLDLTDPADRPKLLGVTVLTSLDSQNLNSVGQGVDLQIQSVRLAKLAKESGLDGVVCSAAEVKAIRDACGPDFVLVVPGIRPGWIAAEDDQKRTMIPRDAMRAGANFLVIGRPITESADPAETAKRIATDVV